MVDATAGPSASTARVHRMGWLRDSPPPSVAETGCDELAEHLVPWS